MVRFRSLLRILPLAILTLAAVDLAGQSLPTPQSHFGFAMGTDEKLARWDGILEYFEILAEGSDRIRVDTLGPTTLGNPFITVTLSSAANLARLEEITATSAVLAQGRVSEEEAERLATDLPATVVINHNIHSTEIGSSQTSVDLVHQLATSTDPDVLEILDNVVTVLIPSANPDGQMMVVDWYNQIVGTEHWDARMPYLYHHYAGHDNNRDFFQGALVETRYWFDVMFRRTASQVYLDQHQMGANGPRIFVPPYPDPMNPLVHPLLWQGIQFMGGGIVRDLQAAGKQGVVSGSMYRIFGQEGALTERFHNVIGLLTETASSNLASPDTVTLEQLQGSARPGIGLDAYEFSMAMPDPWWGGEWRLGDIVDYQTVAAFSVLRQTARFREDYVLGRWQMAKETIERATASGPYAFVIPADQSDPLTAADFVWRLALQGIEVHRADRAFDAIPTVLDTIADVAGIRQPKAPPVEDAAAGSEEGSTHDGDDDAGHDEDESGAHKDEAGRHDEAEDHNGDADGGEWVEPEPRRFEAGSFVVIVPQASRAALMDLLEPRFLPVRNFYPDGPFLRMYDAAAYTMAMQMGVETVRVEEPFDASLTRLTSVPSVAIDAPSRAGDWYALSSEVNQSYRVANDLMEAGFTVHRAEGSVTLGGRTVRGAFLVPAGQAGLEAALENLAVGVPVFSDPPDVANTRRVEPSRIGVYRGFAGSMDEGWTRLLLEEFSFSFQTLSNEDVRSPDLRSRLDVIMIPSEISVDRLVDGHDEEDMPAEYTGGIGDEGVDNLQAFVRAGGTLVTLDRGDQIVLDRFDVPIRNALEDASDDEFFLPASLLNVELSPNHELTAGSRPTVWGKWAGGRAYEPTGWEGEAGTVQVVGKWASDPDDVLAAGQLVGAEFLAGKGAILDIGYGSGRILMYGFRVQHRMQTHGTFRLLFNAFFGGGRPAA